MSRRSLALLIGVTALVSSCGGGDDDATLTPEAAEGRSVVRSKGCAACHGSNGDGGVGPPFVGLYGSDVPLHNGDTVVADRAYLEESIVDPPAKIVAGYNLPMPSNNLSTDEIDAVIAYIEALSEEES